MRNSIKIWESKKIFAALTGMAKPSKNPKTGDLLQLAILPTKLTVTDSIRLKSDRPQCGNCPLAAHTPGPNSCYVNPVAYQSVQKVTESMWVHHWPKLPDKGIRLGSYGDPARLPLELLKQLTRDRLSVGYTHQWKTCRPSYSRYCMASIDHTGGRLEAKAKGYRTFRILGPEDQLEQGEVLCPNYTHGTQCADCGLCNGAREGDKRKDIAIPVHGPINKVMNYG
jgi:hypothetical protein